MYHQILNFRYIHYRFGRIEKQYLQKFEKYIYDNLDTLFIKCGEDDSYIPTVFILYRNIRLTKYMPYIHPCILRGSLFLMNTMEPPQRLSKSWTRRHQRDPRRSRCQQSSLPEIPSKTAALTIVSAKAALESCSQKL